MRPERHKTCTNCSSTFSCGGSCWCNEFPSIMTMELSGDCLCKACLSSTIQTKIQEYISELTPQKIKEVQNLGKPTTLQEGIDYNINQNGNWVFSSWYLLRQGKCCSNGCSNCPYPKKKQK